MSAYRVASRYAKSLLELAVENDILEKVHQDMNGVLSMAGQSPDFIDAIKSPVITSDQKLILIRALFGKTVSPLSMKFFELVSKKGRESLLPDMAQGFHRLYNEHMGIQSAEVVATIQLDEALRNSFKDIVKEVSGKDKVELIEKINPNVIGGFILKIEDRQLDESIKSKLQQLRLGFTQNLYEKKY
ncbi:ATP synthase F1 subunit delta [Cyclobacterium jeungdonense]|uniref:ATP synthase subunit delta n=1 Tax=Cyclobacterium jeungdonense TaxID=708087 RepID=A0ABT8C8L5_9BACT|nr:ATP synthase F1 subunit delta [Cyclobacterium jeungdonense]MDN3687973.1 ATP synthase F1 subunit delta [Cyclobacterium jeungdonense]